MNFKTTRDGLLYTAQGSPHGIPVAIIDDHAPEARRRGKISGEGKFVRAIVRGLEEKKVASQIILSGFAFDPTWLPSPQLGVYLVDFFAGQTNGERRGKEIVDKLIRIGVPKCQIALFTKASDEELDKAFGEAHGFTRIGKFVNMDGTVIGGDDLWDVVVKMSVSFVAQASQSRTLAAIRQWNAIETALDDWPPANHGRLFASLGKGHEAKDWIEDHATLDPAGASWQHGNELLAGLSAETKKRQYSRAAVFTALKGIASWSLSARLFAEATGVSAERCEAKGLVNQKVACDVGSLNACALLGLRTLVSDDGKRKWSFDIAGVTQDALTLRGTCDFGSEAAAREAAKLNKTPGQRMADEPKHLGPGGGVFAVSLLRNIAEVRFRTQKKTLRCEIVLPLEGSIR